MPRGTTLGALVISVACLAQALPSEAQRRGRRRARPAVSAEQDQQQAAKAQAQQLLVAGNQKLAGGLYLEALELFKRALAVYPSPKLHFNIAQTNRELGRFLDALHHYELFVKHVAKQESPEQWKVAHEQIFALQGKIATLRLHVSVVGAGVTIDGRSYGTTPLAEAVRLLPGAHAVVISKEGYDRQVLELTLKGGEEITRRVKLLTEAEGATTRKAVQEAEARRLAAQARLQRTQREERRRRERNRRLLRYSGWSGLIAGGVLLVAGGTFGILAYTEAAKVEDADEQTYWSDVSGAYDRSGTYRVLFYTGLGVGAAAAAAGGVLLYLGHRGQTLERAPVAARKVAVVPVLGPQPGLALRGAF